MTGLLSTQAAVDGPVETLNGNGWVQLDNGTLYGEPLTRARAQGKIAGAGDAAFIGHDEQSRPAR